jgi:hypothetical protein
MNNQAQVSVFVIAGLVILTAAGIIFYLNNLESKEEIAPGIFVAIEEIPTELDPVSNFVSSCLDDVSTTGLKLIGQHGGFLDPQQFSFNANPTESEAVAFAPGSKLKIPYWWYLESDNNCQGTCAFSSKRPSINEGDSSIEKQLNSFIEEQLPSCLNDFESLKEQGFEVTELSDIKADAKIAQEDVIVILNYKLKAKKDDVTTSLDQSFVRIPINLQKIYNLATEITNLEQQYRFLERQTMNLISAFASVDKNKLPPITDMRFEFGSTTSWVKSNVENQITQVLTSYIPLFQVDGTKNFNRDFYTSELKQRLYDSMIVPLADLQYDDLEVDFNYLDFWPIYFDINCEGEICQAESASSNLLAFIGLQRYNFVYDISYPVMVEISDEDALNGRGYNFNFFLEANVRNNEELKSEFVPLQTASIPETSFLCNSGNRNSADVIIKTLDTLEEKPLSDVSITLTVAGESCYIGKTNKNGTLVTKFPSGTAGAVVSFLKLDYISTSQQFDAHLTRELSLEAGLDPVKDKKIIVRKKLVEKTRNGWTFTNKDSELSQNEEAFVTLTRLSDLEESEFSSVATLQGPVKENIRLAPGKYEISINMFLRDSFSIPEKKIRKKTGLFTEREFTLPGVQFNRDNPYPSGGVKLNFTITENDLKKDTITFFAVSPALQNVPINQRSIEDLDQAARIEEYSRSFEPLLQPIFQ